jgi:trehalose 6-phosphate synthase complex regulatory subunit
LYVKFTERTPGSFIEERAASIFWRFWTGPIDDSADRQWARRQVAKAQNHIFDSLGERYGLRIIPGASSFWCCHIISRDPADAILNPGGPVRSPVSMSRVFPTRMRMSGIGKGIGVGGDACDVSTYE